MKRKKEEKGMRMKGERRKWERWKEKERRAKMKGPSRIIGEGERGIEREVKEKRG